MMFKVLIVEDEPSLQILYRKLLTRAGYKVIGIARNGEEAIQLFLTNPIKPDIILMDHRMPVKDGIAATKEILKIDQYCKVIFTSGDETIKDEALSIGAKGFMKKPFSVQNLINEIKKNLNY